MKISKTIRSLKILLGGVLSFSTILENEELILAKI